MGEYKCLCGNKLTDQNVHYWNGCNEEGEEYCLYEFVCEKCKKEVEFDDWGNCENPIDALEAVHDRMNDR